MNHIIIYGAPGTGKSFLATELVKKLNLKHLELDTIREKYQTGKNNISDPFLFLGTTEAYKQFGKSTDQNVIKGLLAVRKRMGKYVSKAMASSTVDLVAEGAFVNPWLFHKKYKTILVAVENDETHMEQFFNHRIINEENLEYFKAARTIQDFLTTEAERLCLEIVSSRDI